jgi:hypothetical protein
LQAVAPASASVPAVQNTNRSLHSTKFSKSASRVASAYAEFDLCLWHAGLQSWNC